MNECEYEKMFQCEDRHWWYVSLHELVLRFINREFRKKGSLDILDAGCGTGRLCQLMRPFGQVEGCDISDLAIGFCGKREVGPVFQADLNSVDLGTGRYDVITSIDVLYHRAVLDDSKVLEKFYRALKPGGLLILNLPAYEYLKSGHDLAVHTARRYSRLPLLGLMTNKGFRIDKSSYRVCLFFPFLALYRLFQRPFIRNRSANDVKSDVGMPPRLINRLLLVLHRLENTAIARSSLPFGTSLFVLGRRPST